MTQQQQMWGEHRNGRPNKAKTSEMPKNDHPATFEQSIPPYAYPAQDGISAQEHHKQRRTNEQYARPTRNMSGNQRFSPDGDALEHGYRPYRHYNYNGGNG